MGLPQIAGEFIMENPIQMEDLGVPTSGTSIVHGAWWLASSEAFYNSYPQLKEAEVGIVQWPFSGKNWFSLSYYPGVKPQLLRITNPFSSGTASSLRFWSCRHPLHRTLLSFRHRPQWWAELGNTAHVPWTNGGLIGKNIRHCQKRSMISRWFSHSFQWKNIPVVCTLVQLHLLLQPGMKG